MNINNLTDQNLKLIFGKVPLQTCIHLRSITKRWQKVIEEMFEERQSLKLFQNLSIVADYCDTLLQYDLGNDDDLRLKTVSEGDDDIVLPSTDIATADLVRPRLANVDTLNGNEAIQNGEDDGNDSDNSMERSYMVEEVAPNPTACHFLVRLFPNIRSLVVGFDLEGAIDLPYLLQHWPRLESLALYRFPPQSHHQIWPALAPLHHTLRRLHLFEMPHEFHAPPKQMVLFVLETFRVDRHQNDLIRTLCQLGPCLSHLLIDAAICSSSPFQALLISNPLAIANLSSLTVGDLVQLTDQPEELVDQSVHRRLFFEHACNLCVNITRLEYNFGGMNVDLAFIRTNLAKLTHLEHARLIDLPTEALTSAALPEQAPSLPTIRRLHLKLEGNIEVENMLNIILANFTSLSSLSVKFDNPEMAANFEAFINGPQAVPIMNGCKFRLYFDREELDILPLMGRHYDIYLKYFVPQPNRNVHLNQLFVHNHEDDDDDEMDLDYVPPMDEELE